MLGPQSNRFLVAVSVACTMLMAIMLTAAPAFAQYRSIDGTGNNNIENDYGASDTQLIRIGPIAYMDGLSIPAGADRPSPRTISNIVFAQVGSIPEPNGVSGFLFQWGQFLDHDLDLTEAAQCLEDSPEDFPVTIPEDDPVFPTSVKILMCRSVYDPATGTDSENPRQQINQITAFIDASNVYGSDEIRASALRTNDGTGRLKTSQWGLPPFNDARLPNAGGTDHRFYLAGDVRANEQVALLAMHTLWVREHNRQADEIASANPGFSGEAIYQAARARVGALMQVITYNEFLPVLLGPGALPPYDRNNSYDENINPAISNEFATAAYRFGHSTLNPVLYRLKKNGQPVPEGNLALRDAFFRFSPIDPSEAKNIDPLLRGLALVPCQAVDTHVVDDLRNFLFGDPSEGGLDLVSLNIQRGRDHGLPSYNEMRVNLGLGPVESFDEISSVSDVRARLRSAYGYDDTPDGPVDRVNLVDLWVGGLAEDPVQGGLVGPTFRAILIDQFERLRDGDSFWYQRVFSDPELVELESTTLTDVIVRNTGIQNGEIGSNAFLTP